MRLIFAILLFITFNQIQGYTQSCNPCFEICDNGVDDNADGLTDCNDPLCQGDIRTFTLSGTPELIDDANIIIGRPGRTTENHGNDVLLQPSVWTESGFLRVFRSLINLPISDIVSSASNVEQAVITLFGVEDLPHSNGGQFGDNALKVQLVTEEWSEDLINWTNQPAILSTPEVIVPRNNDFEYIEIDIAPLLNYTIQNGLPFNGIRLSPVDENNPFRVMVFHSSNSAEIEFRPQFNMVYQDSFNPESCDIPDIQLEIEDGDIYLSDISRGVIMKSPDGQCWRGTLDNTGQLSFVVITCP